MLSFVSIQTKRLKIDDNQSLYYSEPTFKVPLIGYEFPIKRQKVDITKLVESPLTQLIGSNKGTDGEKVHVYQLASNYYTKWNDAVNDLKMMIYKNPKKYLGARTIETNIMDRYFYYYIDTDEITDQLKVILTSPTVDVNDPNNADKEIQENLRIDNARKKFIEAIIEKHFKPNKLNVYLDGFGEAFADPFSAKDSLLAKLQDESKTLIKNYYSFRLENGDEILANIKAEMEKKIGENIVVPSKTIISSDLFRNSMFDSLQDNPDQSGYEVYELEFYGEKIYFPTYNDAWNYLVGHAKYEQHVVNVRNITYAWQDQMFNSTDQYYDQFTKNIMIRKNLKSEVKFYD